MTRKCVWCESRTEHAIAVPTNKEERQKWCEIMEKDPASLPEKCYICASHFDKSDVQRYSERGGSIKMGALPKPMPFGQNERKLYDHAQNFITDIDQIFWLFENLRCFCGGEIEVKKTYPVGTAVQISFECKNCRSLRKWDSQKKLPNSRIYESNFTYPAACAVAGITYSQYDQLSTMTKTGVISRTRFFEKQQNYLWPTVKSNYDEFLEEANMIARQQSPEGLNLAGDGRYDSRGHSAIFCSYTFLDTKTKLILNSIVKDKRKEQCTSNALEPKGLVTGLEEFKSKKVTVNSLATDKNTHIKNLLAKDYPEIQHHLDIWHAVKNLRNDFRTKAKTKKYSELGTIGRHILNHIYFSIKKANGNGVECKERVLSCLNHIVNVHAWLNDKKFTIIKKCDHTAGTPATTIPQNSETYKYIQSVLTKPDFLQTLERLSPNFVTSYLEGFHNLLGLYAPKQKFFDEKGYTYRCMLAILHWNFLMLSERKSTTRMRYSKAQGKMVPKIYRQSDIEMEWKTNIIFEAKQMLIKKLQSETISADEVEDNEEKDVPIVLQVYDIELNEDDEDPDNLDLEVEEEHEYFHDDE